MKKTLAIPLILLAFTSVVVSGAERQKLKNNNSLKSMAGFSIADDRPANMLGLSDAGSLEVRRTYIGKNGDITTRYRQMYKGLPVLGDDIIMSYRSDHMFKRASGSVLYGIARDLPDVVPTISDNQAMQIAKQSSFSNIADADNRPVQSLEYENEDLALSIWQDDEGEAKLVYEVSFVQHGDKPSRPHYIIDAHTGTVLKYFDNLQFANASGPGGNQKTGLYRYGTDFGYMDVSQSGSVCIMNNDNVKTIDLNHARTGSTIHTFTCPVNAHKQINGAYSPLNDAHFFGGVVFNMYNDWLNTAPLTFPLEMRVHYSTNYENAFWNGRSMTFGDGRNKFYPLVSLDVSAHEVSHGFTAQNSGLVYAGKSGGLNEAFSDMAGEAAEYYMLGTNDWMVGEQIFKTNGALRYMNHPPQDGRSIDHQSNYVEGMDVHYSSGVYNKAFYNLATMQGWDTRKAFEVYARANMLYWTANINWDDAGSDVMDVACELGYDTNAVKASLAQVGVNSDVSDESPCRQLPPPPPPPPGEDNLAWLVPIINLILF